MNIAINDRDPLDVAFVAKPERGDRKIVEDAEAASLTAECVMRASGEIASEPTIECILRRTKGSSYAGERATNQTFRPRETDAADDLRSEGSVEKALDVSDV